MTTIQRSFPVSLLVCLSLGCASGAKPPSTSTQTQPGEAAATATAEVEIRLIWQEYLQSKRGYYSSCSMPSDYWLASERASWPCFDLAHSAIPTGMEPALTEVAKVGDGEYRVTTVFEWSEPGPAAATWGDRLSTEVYAVRDRDIWVFSNALPRNTADWRHESVGPLTYVIAPGIQFREDRARQAITFADSVSALFEVPRLALTTFYLTPNLNAAYAAVGIYFEVDLGSEGGFARPINHQVFSGTPAVGEDYRHEIAHLLLMPLFSGTTTIWASEGVATWLGGTGGLDYPGAVARLRSFLETNRAATLDSILTSQAYTNGERYPASAVLAEMVHAHGGVAAVKDFHVAGPDFDAFRRDLERLLDRPWSKIAEDWKARVLDGGVRDF